MVNSSQNSEFDKYNLTHWSQGFFSISTTGEVCVLPNGKQCSAQTVTLNKIVEKLAEQGVSLPVLIRFPQILHQRVYDLCQAFNQAIEKYQYQNNYLLVYPIKVNQQSAVIEALLASQQDADMSQLGLEAGSKPELTAVLAVAQKASSIIICNGYKDREYVRLALIGQKLGYQVYIVLEKFSELALVLEEAEKLKVVPKLGVRVRLAFQGKGKWQSSGGEKSKFGLSAAQVLNVLSQLEQLDMLNSLELVHFHLGSQIANIRDVRQGVNEAGLLYCELRKLGANIQCFDVGGGLAVDYDGSRTQSASSMNYGLAEYANNIVNVLADICVEHQQPMPQIISESGRYLTAHHAVLITDVIGVESYHHESVYPPEDTSPQLLHNMWQSWQELKGRIHSRAQIEIFHDVQLDLAQAHTLFSMGQLSLKERAWAEQLNLRVCYELQSLMNDKNRYHRPIIDELNAKLADKLFVNFSLFQSLPDAWGIDQVFPVVPLSGLNHEPEKRAVVLDITCDSDGSVEYYIDEQGIDTSLPVPKWTRDNPYLIGFFLVGAYQEILGDMHNLFGDTHSAIVTINTSGEVKISDIKLGDTVADVLKTVDLHAEQFRIVFEQLVQENILPEEQDDVLQELMASLDGYTYLEEIS